VEEICDGINQRVYEFYANEAKPKEGVVEFLEYVYQKNIPMTIATSTDRPMIEVALKRVGFHKYIKKIFTTGEVGKGKNHPDIFKAAMSEMNSTEEDTWLFEDALYSIKTAGQMGINTVGIYDFSSDSQQDAIKEKVDIYIKDWSEYKCVIEKIF
jgi:HAD superfamily hydrolase (TIGR01509 family)